MPTYPFRCTELTCGAVQDRSLPIDDRDLLQRCLVCGAPMRREVALPAGSFPGSDQWRTVQRDK